MQSLTLVGQFFFILDLVCSPTARQLFGFEVQILTRLLSRSDDRKYGKNDSLLFVSFRSDEFKFGCTSLRVPPELLYQLRNDITVSPNGVAYVKVRLTTFCYGKRFLHISTLGPVMIPRAVFPLCVQPSVRKGVLPSMLEEILETRIMVKQSMKSYKQDKALMRLLDARQLGLKLIANVTFGYTAANYSGRMPNVEVGEPELGAGRGRGALVLSV